MGFQLPVSRSQRQPLRPLQAGREQQQQPEAQSRRELVQSAAVVLAGLAFAAPVNAASPVISEIKIRESVKGLKESVEALTLYQDFVTQKDFYGIKKSLRVPPVSDIRRDCRRIISGLEGEKVKGDVDKAYGQFIQALEDVDLIATRAIQADSAISEADMAKLGKRYAETQAKLEEVQRLVLTTRFAEPINVRLEAQP